MESPWYKSCNIQKLYTILCLSGIGKLIYSNLFEKTVICSLEKKDIRYIMKKTS